MIHALVGDDHKAIYDFVFKLKSKYTKNNIIVYSEYKDIGSIFSAAETKPLFSTGRRLFILYGLTDKHLWVKTLSKYTEDDFVLSFSTLDKRTVFYKELSKVAETKEFIVKNTSIFVFIDKIVDGDIRYITSNYLTFREELESIEQLIGLLFRHMYLALRIKSLLAARESDDEIITKLKLNKFAYKSYRAYAIKNSFEQLKSNLYFIRWVKLKLESKYRGESSVSEDDLIKLIFGWFGNKGVRNEAVFGVSVWRDGIQK